MSDWREVPPGDAWEMVNEGESAAVRATDSRGRDRQTIAYLLDCQFIEVASLRTVYYAWDAVEAERGWREDHCTCEVLHSDDFTNCTTTKPAEDVWDFWNEDGNYCPWVWVKKDHPNAVKFRRGELKL